VGSTPSSPILVLDTSTLQALHRGEVLSALHGANRALIVPGGVAAETACSREIEGSDRVPDLASLPFIRVVEVKDEELERAGAQLVGPRRRTTSYRILGGTVDRPELEAVLLAASERARLVLEDAKGRSLAARMGVAVTDVSDLLVELEADGAIDDSPAVARRILATNYGSDRLTWLARDCHPLRNRTR
jgi:predicted nucleic acid-binding protein